MKIYLDKDCDKSLLKNKKIGFIGYGSQGRAHALNLKDSGVLDIRIALAPGSKTAQKAKEDGFLCLPLRELGAWADIIIFAAPDEKQSEIYQQLEPHMRPNTTLCFIHGLNIHFNLIKPKASFDVIMVAPKGPGYAVREEFLQNRGVLCLIAVAQDISGSAKNISLAYAASLGCGKAGIIETSFRDETIGDLFGEQAVLCGGLTELIYKAYEVLVENGIEPKIAYLECVHEVKLVVDLIYKKGLAAMDKAISNTAEWGQYQSGPKIIDANVKEKMQAVLNDITKGAFVENWMKEYKSGLTNMQRIRTENQQKPIEKIGLEIRSLLPWLN